MEKDIFDIILEKDFHQLNATEREELSELCSNETEFEQMKLMLGGVEVLKTENYSPREETKQRLDELFVQSHPKAGPIWYNSVLAVVIPKDKPIYRQPLAQIAAILLLVFLAVPFFNNRFDDPTVKIAQVDDKKVEVESELKNEIPVIETELPNEIEEESDVIEMETVQISEELASTRTAEPELNRPGVSETTAGTTFAFSTSDTDDMMVSEHPDGVFIGEIVEYSIPASEEPELFDLLTATF